MSFLSFAFFGFAALVLLLYWLLPHRAGKYLLLGAGCFFYIGTMPALSLLLFASIGLSYLAARAMEQRQGRRRKIILALACLFQFGLLFVFKYLQMLLDIVQPILPGAVRLSLILPVGISFYTFTVTGYLFDVYRGKTPAERNLADYALFVSFFPCILAGPINRARDFLPQLKRPIPFRLEMLKSGVLRFLFGMLQKMVLADNLAVFVDRVYSDGSASPAALLAAIVLYSLQIYFDFSGYSHMAIGLAEAFGLRVPENFRAPYFSASVTAFWKKWHMSLTAWFREYLYFPLGGSRKGKLRTYFNILVVFAVSGLWHGAAMHYVLWGLACGALQVLERLALPARRKLGAHMSGKLSRTAYDLICGALAFFLISLTWVLFRAADTAQAFSVFGRVLAGFRTGFGALPLTQLGLPSLLRFVLLAAGLVCAAADLAAMRGMHLRKLTRSTVPYYLVCAVLILTIALFGVYGAGFDPQDFVYFRY